MTLEQYILSQKNVVASNFPTRNSPVFINNQARSQLLKQQRRQTVRNAVKKIRLAQSNVTGPMIAARVQWLVG